MKKKLIIREEILQQCWSAKMLGIPALKTVSNQELKILDFGVWNRLQGPDFSGVKIEFDHLLLAGDVEFHWTTSDWNKHLHHTDKKYNNVILHVVWIHDSEVCNSEGNAIPVLQLSDYFLEKDLQKLQNKVSSVFHSGINEFVLKCSGNEATKQPELWKKLVHNQYEVALQQRLQSKLLEINQLAVELNQDWESIAFVYMGKYWVDNQNRLAAERLFKSIPLTFVKRSPLKELLAYSWVLGKFPLNGSEITSAKQFQEQMNFLSSKFGIKSLDISWYYGKIRPQGWIHNRIMQYFIWLHGLDGQISEVLVDRSMLSLNRFLVDSNHFLYMGSTMRLNEIQATKVIVNAIIPLQMAYMLHREVGELDYRGWIELMKLLPSESNRIIREYSLFFGDVSSAYDAQGMLNQVNNYCRKGLCSQCLIGNYVLKNQKSIGFDPWVSQSEDRSILAR